MVLEAPIVLPQLLVVYIQVLVAHGGVFQPREIGYTIGFQFLYSEVVFLTGNAKIALGVNFRKL